MNKVKRDAYNFFMKVILYKVFKIVFLVKLMRQIDFKIPTYFSQFANFILVSVVGIH
jgi:hypothetical protein